METSGIIVCLEGIDGAGKNTQTEMLSTALKGEDIKTEAYSYPDYKTRYGKIIREYLDRKIEMDVGEFFFLQMLDKQKDMKKIQKGIKDGKVLIMDRYVYSQIAYQTAGGFNYDAAKKIVELSGMPKPDVVFYLDIPSEDSLARKNKQHSGTLDRHEAASDYLNKVRGVYDKLYSEHFGCRNWIKIDGLKKAAEIHEEISREVSKLLAKKG